MTAQAQALPEPPLFRPFPGLIPKHITEAIFDAR